MSSPPGSTLYGVQPVDTPFSGTTDANGGFTQKIIPRSAYWTVLKVVGMATGNPTWTLYKSGATIPIDFGLGPNVSMGPILVAPQQDITLVIKNALPKLPVTGTLTGLQASDLQSVVGHFQPQSSFVTVGAQGALPTDFNPVRFTTAAVTAGATVIPVADTSIFAPDQAVDIPPGGTHLVQSVQIGVSITLQTAVTANIPAGSPVMRVGVVGIFGQPIAVTFNPANSGSNHVTPAPWQAANQQLLEFEVQVPASSSVLIIPSPGGTLLIYLHSLAVWTISHPVNSKFAFTDTFLASNIIHTPDSGNFTQWNFDLKGAPLANSSSGVSIQNSGTAITDFIIGTIAYSIG